MKAKRRRHDAAFKARVALEALRGIKTIQQIAQEYDLHPVQVSDWKKIVQERLASVFDPSAAPDTGGFEKERIELQSKIGELTIKLDFVTKKSKQLGL